MDELSLPKALAHPPDAVMLGIFQPNMQANQFTTAAPGLTESNYESNRRVAMLADDIGISFALTVGRWKGIPGDSVGYATFGFDTYTLAAALLEATERITIFSTTHTAVWNPVIAAKLGADLDQIGRGRWGVNIVAGWSEDEFRSLGVTLFDHEKRYAQATEWLTAVRELWTEGESSFSGEFFTLDRAECHPRPLQQGGPVVVNAGRSPTGMKFAADNGEYLFSASPNLEQFRQVRDELHSDVGYIGRKRVIIAETDAAANEKANDMVRQADLLAIARGRGRQTGPDGKPLSEIDIRAQLAGDEAAVRKILLDGATIGSPETVASELAEWILGSSVDGVCMALFDFERDLELLAARTFEPLGNALADAGKTLKLTTN